MYALVGLGVLVTGREMVRLHPYQQVYFNALVNRTTPEALGTAYALDPWRISCREGLDFLRRRFPDTTVRVSDTQFHQYYLYRAWLSLPQADRIRLILVGEGADVLIRCGKKEVSKRKEGSPENALYVLRVYNSTLLTVSALITVPDRKRSLANRVESYRKFRSGELVQQAEFDLYSYPHDRLLGYARDQCTADDVRAKFFLHIVPVEVADLPATRRQYGFDNLDFYFKTAWEHQRMGQCWVTVVLPDYPISRIRTGQFLRVGPNRFKQIWKIELSGQSLAPALVSPERGNGNDETTKTRSRHSPPLS